MSEYMNHFNEKNIVIDGYEYFSYITEEFKNKFNTYWSYIKANDEIEYFALQYAFWCTLEKELIKNLTDLNDELCKKFSIIFNIKNNLEYIIINKFDTDLLQVISKIAELCSESNAMIFNKFYKCKRNINCDMCCKLIHCKCNIYHKKIPFSLCRINKFFGEGVISEYKEDKLIHFCGKKCEELYYIENVSKIKKLN